MRSLAFLVLLSIGAGQALSMTHGTPIPSGCPEPGSNPAEPSPLAEEIEDVLLADDPEAFGSHGAGIPGPASPEAGRRAGAVRLPSFTPFNLRL